MSRKLNLKESSFKVKEEPELPESSLICHLCLCNSEHTLPLFEESSKRVLENIRAVFQIEPVRDEAVSDKICTHCIKKIEDFIAFRQMVIDNHQKHQLAVVEEANAVPVPIMEPCVKEEPLEEPESEIYTEYYVSVFEPDISSIVKTEAADTLESNEQDDRDNFLPNQYLTFESQVNRSFPADNQQLLMPLQETQKQLQTLIKMIPKLQEIIALYNSNPTNPPQQAQNQAQNAARIFGGGTSSTFGQSSTPSVASIFGGGTTSAFGGSSATTTESILGKSSTFGAASNQQASIFGKSTFEQPEVAAAPTPNPAGAFSFTQAFVQQPQQGTSIFGGGSTLGASPFGGGASQAVSGGSIFGGSSLIAPQQPAVSTQSIFGGGGGAGTTGGGPFSQQSAFGTVAAAPQPQANQTSSIFCGSAFGGSSTATPSPFAVSVASPVAPTQSSASNIFGNVDQNALQAAQTVAFGGQMQQPAVASSTLTSPFGQSSMFGGGGVSQAPAFGQSIIPPQMQQQQQSQGESSFYSKMEDLTPEQIAASTDSSTDCDSIQNKRKWKLQKKLLENEANLHPEFVSTLKKSFLPKEC